MFILGSLESASDFLLLLSELFSLGVSAEPLQAKRSKIGDFAPARSL